MEEKVEMVQLNYISYSALSFIHYIILCTVIYSSLLEIVIRTLHSHLFITQYGSTVYIGMALVCPAF